MLSPAEKSLLGRANAHASWANTENRSARTAPARAALDQKFLDAANGDPVRAAHLRKAHFARLALKSAQSRRKAREAREAAVALDEAADQAEQALGDAGDAAEQALDQAGTEDLIHAADAPR